MIGDVEQKMELFKQKIRWKRVGCMVGTERRFHAIKSLLLCGSSVCTEVLGESL